MTTTPGPTRRPIHGDRVGVPPGRLAALATTTCLSLGLVGYVVTERGSVPPVLGVGCGVLVALLAIFGLPSISLRMTTWCVLVAGGVLLLSFGVLGSESSGVGALPVVGWVAASVGVLVLGDAITSDVAPLMHRAVEGPRWTATARSAVAVVVVVLLFALVAAPPVERLFARTVHPGNPPTLGASSSTASPLQGSRELDMSSQPHLSDRVVMTVDAARPSFYRGEIYDAWNGHEWIRTEDRQYQLADNAVLTAPSDVGAQGSDELRQTFHIVAPFSDVVYAAPSAVSVHGPVDVAQRLDGTLTAPLQPLRSGDQYTVVSRRVPATEAQLRGATGAVPPAVGQDAADPVATARVRALAKRITRGIPDTFDRVQAIEAWMGRHVKYSLTAPVAARDKDVVDDFLFHTKLGWCEQVASSLVVMLRVVGVPARFVTGFVPEGRDAVSGSFVVRERDAHAWTEVWFPNIGWVSFDPTAHVPLAGQETSSQGVAGWLVAHGLLLVALAAVGAGLWALGRWLLRRRRRVQGEERRSGVSWVGSGEVALERLGSRLGRPRAPGETCAQLAVALAGIVGDVRLVRVGRILDDAVYAPGPRPPEDHGFVEATLRELAKARAPAEPAPPREPAGVG